MTPASDANASIIESGMAMQQAQLERQEEALGDLSGALSRIKRLGGEMTDELRGQSHMLSQLETQVDNASQAMDTLKRKIKEMAASKDRGKCCAILVLSAVLFGLTCLVLYT